MRKTLYILFPFLLAYSIVCSQKKSYRQSTSLGIHFIFNDFATATAIRNSSLSSVLKNKKFGKLEDMSQGLALSYGKGISEHFDFYSTLSGSFLSYPFINKATSTSDHLLMEGDACIRGKILTDKYWVVPYLQVGLGVSKYEGYWGTFIPAGIGIQISFFEEAYLQLNSQYRIAVTESTSYHFVHSIGLVGNIGKMIGED
jgi:OOP family OmpA-OmpF porin